MKLEWLNHTGIIVSDMERSLAFYKGLLGMKEERNLILEGEDFAQLVGLPNAKLHIVYVGIGDMRHSIELVQYLNPPGRHIPPTEIYDVGTAHIGLIVDDLDAFYKDFSDKGVEFVGPPFFRPDAEYPWARKAAYLQDPDGNRLEMIERAPAPPDARIS